MARTPVLRPQDVWPRDIDLAIEVMMSRLKSFKTLSSNRTLEPSAAGHFPPDCIMTLSLFELVPRASLPKVEA